jgi:DNA polymerase-3 subunit gamma/tau
MACDFYQQVKYKSYIIISLQGMFFCMSQFIVSARKYRPASFDTVVGQSLVATTLKSAIRSKQIAHAYLFCGPRGVGKTTCARIFAKTLNCFQPSPNVEACGICESCKSFSENRSFNIHELDAASNNSVDDIRSLIEKVRILPQVGQYSIYIIDEVHMLSQSAFNAFLKTLEEPPAHAIFVLATTEKHKIIPTILSRCQIFDFHRLRAEDISAYLADVAHKENIAFEEEALHVIAMKADGAMRDALSIFDQVASFSGRNITYQEVLENLNVLDYEYYFRITAAFLEGNAAQALLIFNDILQRGFDSLNFLGGLSSHLRDLLVCQDESTLPLLEVSENLRLRYNQQAKATPVEFLFSALELCSRCEMEFKSSRNQRLHVELALIRLCNLTGEKKKIADSTLPILIPEMPKAENQNSVRPKAASEEKPANLPRTVVEPETSYNQVSRISIKETLRSIDQKPDLTDTSENSPLESPVEIVEELFEPVQEGALQTHWHEYAEQIREEKPRMAVALRNLSPIITDGFRIAVHFSNRSQLENFRTHIHHDLECFLKQKLKRSGLVIDAQLDETPEVQHNKLYTSEEKFQYLNKKNPLLNKFLQQLNLELE